MSNNLMSWERIQTIFKNNWLELEDCQFINGRIVKAKIINIYRSSKTISRLIKQGRPLLLKNTSDIYIADLEKYSNLRGYAVDMDKYLDTNDIIISITNKENDLKLYKDNVLKWSAIEQVFPKSLIVTSKYIAPRGTIIDKIEYIISLKAVTTELLNIIHSNSELYCEQTSKQNTDVDFSSSNYILNNKLMTGIQVE